MTLAPCLETPYRNSTDNPSFSPLLQIIWPLRGSGINGTVFGSGVEVPAVIMKHVLLVWLACIAAAVGTIGARVPASKPPRGFVTTKGRSFVLDGKPFVCGTVAPPVSPGLIGTRLPKTASQPRYGQDRICASDHERFRDTRDHRADQHLAGGTRSDRVPPHGQDGYPDPEWCAFDLRSLRNVCC